MRSPRQRSSAGDHELAQPPERVRRVVRGQQHHLTAVVKIPDGVLLSDVLAKVAGMEELKGDAKLKGGTYTLRAVVDLK